MVLIANEANGQVTGRLASLADTSSGTWLQSLTRMGPTSIQKLACWVRMIVHGRGERSAVDENQTRLDGWA